VHDQRIGCVIWLEHQKCLLDCAEWLDIVINAMVKSCRFVPECVFARRLAKFRTGQKNGIGNPSAIVGGIKNLEISGFITTGQWQRKLFFSLLPLLWLKTRIKGD
jgi:hypothetical protein